jgi:hypothetical protein
MAHALDSLLQRRQALLDQISALPPFRRGIVLERARACGKPSCRCAKDPAHAHSQYQWSVSDHGKTRNKNLHLGPEVEKFLEETVTYRTFQELVSAYTLVNEQIADLQPAAVIVSDDALATLKKKLRRRLARPSQPKSANSSRS